MKRYFMNSLRLLVTLGLALLVAACSAGTAVDHGTPYRVVAEFPHDTSAFTQGLLFHAGDLYESTGLYGRSTLRQVNLDDGRVRRQHNLDRRLFGEGLALVGDRLIQLTWKENIALVYRLADFKPIGQFEYAGEGWGLAYDGRWLVMSDGSDTLRYRDVDNFTVLRELRVTDDGRPVRRLNELTVIGNEIWANILGSDRVARIDPVSGVVLSWLDLSPLRKQGGDWRRAADLNGIAWDPEERRIFATGKLWPVLYELQVDGVGGE
ncbi:MAG: glutaminyl-peptide cyclotransferase [Porticoccaceae bacterium]|nr:glutaminyl-peptide cyclotransferase [Porticoccaceae bacterium]